MPIKTILDAKNRQQVASLLKSDYYKHLIYYLYKKPMAARYREKVVSKKNGGERTLNIPNGNLVHIQKQLSNELYKIYKPNSALHSFAKRRSVVTNATLHLNSTFILNVDLKDYFPSINFGRVRGRFLAKPYSLNDEVATVLAQICTHNNELPQGAPTSPVVSNMVTGRLDNDLRELANTHGLRYSRYADDITFSTRRKTFPRAFAYRTDGTTSNSVTVGRLLNQTIQKNGFEINDRKTRLLTRSQRQEVTGIVVNEHLNVPRSYVKQLRCMLHAWEKFGEKNATVHHQQMYRKGKRALDGGSIDDVVRGKLNHLARVKGNDDPVYAALAYRFNNQTKSKPLLVKSRPTYLDQIKKAVWLIESDDPCSNDAETINQGTGFFLEGTGFVTCAHVLGARNVIFCSTNPAFQFEMNIVAIDKELDLAILEPKSGSIPVGLRSELTAGDKNTNLTIGANIRAVGFPGYATGNEITIQSGEIVSFRSRPISTAPYQMVVNCEIAPGNSGGPVLQGEKVVGVAHKGHSMPNTVMDIRLLASIEPLETPIAGVEPLAGSSTSQAADGQSLETNQQEPSWLRNMLSRFFDMKRSK